MDSTPLKPYKYHCKDKYDYFFTTERGKDYHVYFVQYGEPSMTYGALFTFNIATDDVTPHPVDIRIAHTVVAILAEFFETDVNSAIIVCDNSDQKEEKRFRLFDRWYQHFNIKNVLKYDSSVITPYYNLFVSLFLREDNPFRDNVVKEYYRMISEEFSITGEG